MHVAVPEDLHDGQAFVERLQEVYGLKVAGDILARLNRNDELVSFWLNPLVRESSADTPEIPASTELTELPALRFSRERESVTHSQAATEGDIYIQNPSSYFAATVVGVTPGMEVLDLAAAPGGKTIALAALLGNSGRIAAVEPVAGRFHRLRANVERCGATVVDFYQRDGRGVGRAVPERFDRVLLDAPCSSEARMRWQMPGSYRHWQLRKIRETQRKQKALIMSGYQALKPQGFLTYCTCSFAPEENEVVVEHLLKRTDAEIVPIESSYQPPLSGPGLSAWRGRTFKGDLTLSMRILPTQLWDGFFIARIRKP